MANIAQHARFFFDISLNLRSMFTQQQRMFIFQLFIMHLVGPIDAHLCAKPAERMRLAGSLDIPTASMAGLSFVASPPSLSQGHFHILRKASGIEDEMGMRRMLEAVLRSLDRVTATFLLKLRDILRRPVDVRPDEGLPCAIGSK